MYTTGKITLGTAGLARTFTGLGFDPTWVRFRVGAKNGGSANHTSSEGATDGTTQWVCYEFDDYASHHSDNASDTECIKVLNYSSGWVDDLKASFNSFITDGFSLDVAVANSNFPVYFEAGN